MPSADLMWFGEGVDVLAVTGRANLPTSGREPIDQHLPARLL